MKYSIIALLVFVSLIIKAQHLEITLKNGDAKEVEGKKQMERIVMVYDVEINKWFFTKSIVIDKTVIPFSHPVLTLNCNYLDNDHKQLSNFVHEQFHWFMAAMRTQEKKAINAFKEIFPNAPVGGREGARDEYSSYLHLIVCDLEFQAMTKVIGEESARRLLAEWTHYTWIYKTVLENKQVREINVKNGFVAP